MNSRDPLAGRIPVTVLTGFLGAGKTTLLKRLLTHPGMARAAVVINEIGEIGIDNDLVTVASENISLLANGCICCTVRTDLQETLRELFAKRKLGEIPDYDRVIVETTGLADPAPVIQTIATDSMLTAYYRLDGLVTLVDGVLGAGQLDRQSEAQKQAAVADRLVITKSDISDEDAIDALRERLAALNPSAQIALAVKGDIDPAFLTGIGLRNARGDAPAIERFLGLGEARDGEREGYLGSRLGARHDTNIRTFSLRFAEPFAWNTFAAALELVTKLRGPDLLRMKGIVNVAGEPMVVQGVQHIFETPIKLARWPSDDRSSRLVFIARGIERATVEALFTAARGLGSA
jgi:G3E family GTPase